MTSLKEGELSGWLALSCARFRIGRSRYFADNVSARSKDLFDHKSLHVTNIDVAESKIDVEIGNIFDKDKAEREKGK